ncbi:hypothetical protein TraAM80_08825 [Trypanosoma rangeli]|uniref:Sfi1 spindle body domain-containing protein n=1 Tax=Trypanosoma rangeli TaxID=5698 RepID=A0A422MYK4_TRYRA|nr:uncharacterized protein TraAM80_08825 [Trypanosoma rangeli]RNE98324.1 hypothetical protein TraAM80_08825 [Trypanosoma rangeli]|eukprot:RNE98324.1 hypothetical protein TraAM80_08825 [Trypanosoma rangeli]
MDGDLKELQNRLSEAEERIKKTTRLMLRAVWQYVTQHHSSSMVRKGSSVAAAAAPAPHMMKVAMPHPRHHHALQPRRQAGAATVQHRKGAAGAADQARLSRELYRKAFGEARQEAEMGTVRPADPVEETEGGSIPSVALVLLQSSRERAIMSAFLLRLRVAAHRRRFLYEECELRYTYYRLRRVLRAWFEFVREVNSRRRRLLCGVLAHWVSIVERRRQMQECLRRFCVNLEGRRRAFAGVRRRKLRQCFLRWRERLDLHRIVEGMEERATEMRRRHKYVKVASVGQPTAVFTIKDRVFAHWKKKTEHRLDTRLAEWVSKRFLMRHVWNELIRCYVSARQQRTELESTLPCGPPTVYVAAQRAEFTVFKVRCAQQIARGRLRKTAFALWRAKCRNRLSDRLFVFHRRVRVMKAWLQALRRKRVTSFVTAACWCRWRQRLYLRLQNTQAQSWRRQWLQRSALRLWHSQATCSLFYRQQTLHACCAKWWGRARLRWARRRLALGIKRRVLLSWRDVVVCENNQRALTCVAETLRELVLLMGCFRRWRGRYEHACRAHLSESILSELRRERQRARLFQRWKRLTFWSHAACKDLKPPS